MLWSFWLTVTLSLCWVISSKRGKERSLLKIPGFELVDKAQFKLQNETDDPSLVLFHSYSSPSSTPAFKFFKELPSKMEKQMPFVKLRAFDCIGAVEVCAELNIPKYPTAVLFANKNKYRYDGRYSWKPFANWMKELLIISSREVRNMYEFNFFIKRFTNSEKKPVIFFCGSSSHVGFKSFEELSKNRKSEQYLFSEDPSVMQKFNCTSGDTLFLKSTGEVKKNQHHSNKPYSLERFVLSNEYPNVSLLSLYHYRDFFDDSKAMLLVLDSHQDENMLELLDKVSALHKSSMSVYYLYPHDHNKALVRKVESLLGTAYDDYPCVRYIKLQDQKLKKFKMTGNISSRKINLFLKAIQKGKIAPYLRSQPQKVHHKHFKRLVGTNFEPFYKNPFFTSCILLFKNYVSCPKCKEAFLSFKLLAKEFSKTPKIQFATLNEAKNDFSLESTKLPSFVCSIMNHKEEEPLWLTEDLSFKKMKEMVERTVSFSDEPTLLDQKADLKQSETEISLLNSDRSNTDL